jgi:hypothetical protein
LIPVLLLCGTVARAAEPAASTRFETGFRRPADAYKPWVFWFWMNGNISREGITKDLESMKQVGIGGVLWMEVSGPWWAPQGPIEPGSASWHEAMQWAIREADRLGMGFALSVDFGYGSGGPHITPDRSMQQLVWTETAVQGGKPVQLRLEKAAVDYRPALKKVWLRPGQQVRPAVMKGLREVDSYRDVAVLAYRASRESGAAIRHLEHYDGRGWKTHLASLAGDAWARGDVIDISDRMTDQGELRWDAPPGDWKVVRLGYASNFKMTRPSPTAAVGLECDRLHRRGIETHFEHRLKPILDAAGDMAGRTLQFVHIDSWEAHGQNWTEGFAGEFRKRRGYDLRPWLLVLTGRMVESPGKTERFLWDLRQTVNEVILSSYIDRLRDLIEPYGVRFSCEPYGRLCVDSLTYGGRSDFPIAEFWTERKQPKRFPTFSRYWYTSMKGLASVANTYGKARVGAEAFTGARGWIDHPYLIKGMGDEAFCGGVSHYVIHLSAHQPYDRMKPGLTHRKWGQHFQRHQTWWPFSRPYFDYVARCQFLLQQGRRVVDVACLYHEGAPLNFNDIAFALPPGYDHDFIAPEIVQRMDVREGRIHLPTGVSYAYLVLPRSGRVTLPTARKVEALRQAGARVYAQASVVGTPGLTGYPEADREVRKLAREWPALPKGGFGDLFASDGLKPDFTGEGLKWIHRRTEGTDLYFIANTLPDRTSRECAFRTTGSNVELWNPETGEVSVLPGARQAGDHTIAVIPFEPAQSWFVVFREKPTAPMAARDPFASWNPIREIKGRWTLRFDPDWGRADALTIEALDSWSNHADPLVKYYSGTATYRRALRVTEADIARGKSGLGLDLGRVEVMARVTLNGKVCGIVWKPPYRVEITRAVVPGENALEIEVVNTWVNRMIGDEQLPLDSKWKDWETLLEWPAWFKAARPSPSGRYTFTSARHYDKRSPLMPSGLLGPVRILACE